jgi:DNA repair photolyase
MTQIKEIESKSIIQKSKLPDTDYVINPYTGCVFGCAYCYASFMGKFVGEPFENWGNYLYVKKNAVELARKELAAWDPELRDASILLSSVTDPYQGAEKEYRLTEGILRALADCKYPGLISILTKSPLVLRDVDILRALTNVEVGVTVTTTDDKTSRFLEVRAPLASARIETLKKLHDLGFPTYAFVGPLLPHYRFYPDLLDELFARLADTGTTTLFVEHMNINYRIRTRLVEVLAADLAEAQDVYSEAGKVTHRAAVEEHVKQLVEKYGFKLRLQKVLSHQEDKKH